MFLKNIVKIKITQIEHRIPIQDSVFSLVRGLMALSYVLYDYTTRGRMDL